MSYVQGTVVKTYCEVEDENGQPLIPTALEHVVKMPDGTEVMKSLAGGGIVQVGTTNVYRATIDTGHASGGPGVWHYQFKVPGAEAIVERGKIDVRSAV